MPGPSPSPNQSRSPAWIRPWLLAANLAAAACVLAPMSPKWLVGVAMGTHALLVYAIFIPTCGWLGPVVTRFKTDKKQVWLTLDDGPDGANSTHLAQEMARRGVRATFFVKGRLVARQPEVARHILGHGHTLANHTDTHPIHLFWSIFPKRLRREIDRCNQSLAEANANAHAESAAPWFRSPLGLKPIFLHGELAKRRMRLIAWSVRGHDGVRCHAPSILRRVVSKVRPGDIVLLHEGRAGSNDAVLRVVDALQQRGYSFVIPGNEQLV